MAAVAYFYLKGVAEVQTWVFTTLPGDLEFSRETRLLATAAPDGVAACWSVSRFAICREPVGTNRRGVQGVRPVARSSCQAASLASFATAQPGRRARPEAPLIAIGSRAGCSLHCSSETRPRPRVMVIGAAGSFAAVSTLLGSPWWAFLLMEASDRWGMMGVILIPGMLAAGVGTLIFVGLDNWTGYGTFSLSIPNIPPFTTPTLAEFLWAIGIGLAAAVIGTAIKRPALRLQPVVERRMVVLTPVAGLGIGAAAVAFGELTTHSSSEVLFSGQDALPALIEGAAGWTVGALVLLMIFKGVAYSLALSCFRGGPTFPGMFIGAAGGIALSHLPGLPMIAGAAMGIGAMTVAMLGLPLTSVLLATLFLSADGLALTPLVIVAVVVAYVASARLTPLPDAASAPAQPTARPTPGRCRGRPAFMGRLIDADDCVLILVDVQEGFLERVEPEAKAGLIERIAFLTLSARFCGIPVVATVESPADWGGLHPGLVEAVGDAPVIEKAVFGLAGDPLAGPAVRHHCAGKACRRRCLYRRCPAPLLMRPCRPHSGFRCWNPGRCCLARQRACGGHRADAPSRGGGGAHQAAPLRVDAHGQAVAPVRSRPPRPGAAARRRAVTGGRGRAERASRAGSGYRG